MPHSKLLQPSSSQVSQITGNASEDIKEFLGDLPKLFNGGRTSKIPTFGQSIMERMKVTEISVLQKPDEPKKSEGRVVIELEVGDEMLNGAGNVHGGCSAFLVDICSTLALMALEMATGGDISMSVSQSLNLVYHSPASPGDKLKIVNTTLTLGSRALSARTEIWNVTHHRLVVSGTHIKMAPGVAKTKL